MTKTLSEEENKLRAAMTELDLSPYCHAGMVGYILHGRPVGGFLVELLKNDLMEAVFMADDLNGLKFYNWALFLHNHTPRACYGSPKAFKAWCKAGGLSGIKAKGDET